MLADKRAAWENAPRASIGDPYACEFCADTLYDAIFLRIDPGWFDESLFPNQIGRVTLVHELFHVVQWHAIGAENTEIITHANPSLLRLYGPNWLVEGSAQWWGWRSTIQDSGLEKSRLFEYDNRRTVEDTTRLDTMETPAGWSAAHSEFGVGHVAVEFLMNGRDPADFVKYYNLIGSGTGSRYRMEGKLVSDSGAIPAGAFVNACPVEPDECIGGEGRTAPSGTFAMDVPPGAYWLNVNVPGGSSGPLGWYREGGLMVSNPSTGGTMVNVQGGPIVGIVFRIP